MNAPKAMIWPCVNYHDAQRAIDFLVTTLGFLEGFVSIGEDGRHIQHAELHWPDGGGVMLGSAKADGTPFEQLPTGASGLYVVAGNLDEVYHRAHAAGADVVSPLVDREYGSTFTIRDLEGNVWSFGNYQPDGAP